LKGSKHRENFKHGMINLK